ncbi:MarR family transcriptional regulator [Bacillus sp. CLL-7-23]|uniref:MarR family transcriptional regulator n=1 Tax=Bacillus changyiensis TaxID=3004103 RepID=A0ABT4WZ43_9BACI|nr:MarR family transcriptional regulator [Bacillus changyiensis]MDA7025321.1 MarR family transcriptional regulator [Bacillus changyiensis]
MEKNEMCIQFLLAKALQRVSQLSKSKFQTYGITPVQFSILRELWRTDGQLGSELGKHLRIDSATITGIIDRMERNGFIKRQSDPHDRRNKLIFLTEKGKEMEVILTQKMVELNHEVMEDFNVEETRWFKKMLNTIGSGDMKKNENQSL